jgi:hypothetical protein
MSALKEWVLRSRWNWTDARSHTEEWECLSRLHPGLKPKRFPEQAAREFPIADEVMHEGFLIGCHHGMDEADVARVCGILIDFAKSHLGVPPAGPVAAPVRVEKGEPAGAEAADLVKLPLNAAEVDVE